MSKCQCKNNPANSPDEKELEYDLVPPDGGWGWLVLGGSVLINLLIPGTIKSFGVLFIEFLEVFDASPVAASWIPALCYFLYCSLGPLASYLSGQFGYRAVTLLGGMCAGIGMILSFFANSITYLYVRGAVLIMGGLTLNVWVGAMLYEPVEYHMKRVPKQKMEVEEEFKQQITEPEEKGLLEIKIMESKEGYDDEVTKILDSPESPIIDKVFKDANQPLLLVDSCNQLNRKISPPPINLGRPVFAVGSTGHLTRKISSCSYVSKPNLVVGSTGQISRKPSLVSRQIPRVNSASQMSRKISVASNMSNSSFRYVSTAFHGSTLVGLNPEFSSNLTLKSVTKPFDCYGCCSNKKSIQTVSQQNLNNKKSSLYGDLLTDPVFLIILISNASNAIGYTNFTILLPAYAVNLGFDKSKASLLLSIVAVFDLVGRIGGSALSDWLPIDKKAYFVGGLLISGLSLAALPFATTYNGLSIFCGIFGLASGTYVGITAVIIVDLLGEDRLASSYGVSLFVNGVLQLIGPPICGAAFERLNSYKLIFSTLGSSLIIGASVWCFLPFVRKRDAARELK
ncbi:solute carrier family 16 member hermes isoform X3 [Lycorma delicatula]|uniref:solute carrier family 16 member hermes isoform X3 n=1 Tax=Lycorma delicatula TaxID=130591 RepID=UPI003F511288